MRDGDMEELMDHVKGVHEVYDQMAHLEGHLRCLSIELASSQGAAEGWRQRALHAELVLGGGGGDE